MSTSPETSPNPSPSNKKTELLSRGFLVAFGFFVAAAVSGALIGSLPLDRWVSELGEKQASVESIEPLVHEAKMWPMTYETAEAGRPVVWCVDHPTRDDSYLEGRPSDRIFWTNADSVPINSLPRGRCIRVVAMVEGRKPQGVVLKFVAAL
jgi:hypothetical protein